MNNDAFLRQARLPARLTMEQAAALLGFQAHDIPILVRQKLLKPLGSPTPNAPKYFPAIEVEKHSRDVPWLDRATKILSQHWLKMNQARRSKSQSTDHNGAPAGSDNEPVRPGTNENECFKTQDRGTARPAGE